MLQNCIRQASKVSRSSTLMRKAFSSYKFGPNADVDAMFDDYMKSYKRKAIDERVQEIAEIMHGKDYADVAEITKTYDFIRRRREQAALPEDQQNLAFKYQLYRPMITIPLLGVLLYPLAASELFLITDMALYFQNLLAYGVLYALVSNFGLNYENDVHVWSWIKFCKRLEFIRKAQVESDITSTEALVGTEEVYSDFHTLVDDMAALQAEILNVEQENSYRESVSKKLDSLLNMERTVMSNMKAKVVEQIKTDVNNQFRNDKKLKETAFNQAVAVLSGGVNAKMGRDLVGEVFTSSIKEFRANYEKQDVESDPAIVQLKKDLMTASVAPAPELKGGNMYDNFPQIQKFLA